MISMGPSSIDEFGEISVRTRNFFTHCFIPYYKDWKCTVNENPSVRIQSARSKTSNNGPLRNRSAVSVARLYVGSKIVCFYESNHGGFFCTDGEGVTPRSYTI